MSSMSSTSSVVTIGSLIKKDLKEAYFLLQQPSSYSKAYRFFNDTAVIQFKWPTASVFTHSETLPLLVTRSQYFWRLHHQLFCNTIEGNCYRLSQRRIWNRSAKVCKMMPLLWPRQRWSASQKLSTASIQILCTRYNSRVLSLRLGCHAPNTWTWDRKHRLLSLCG